MTRRNIITTIAIAALAVGAWFTFKPNNTKTDAGLTEIRFGISPYQDTLLPILGSDEFKGWFRQEGLNVKFKIMALDEVREALAAGQLDVTINDTAAIIGAWHKQNDIVYLYGFNTFDNGFALMARPDSGIRSVAEIEKELGNHEQAIIACAKQFKGKSFISTGNSDFEMAVASAVQRGGLRYSKGADSDVTFIDLPPDEGLAAFLSGKGDIYLGGIPQRTRAGKEGMKEIMAGLDLGPAPINGLCTTRTFYKAHKEDLAKVLNVWFKIVNYADSQPDEAGKSIAGVLNRNTGAQFTVDDFKKFWQHYEHYPLTPSAIEKDILSPDGHNYLTKRWNACNDFFYGLIKVNPSPVTLEQGCLMGEFQSFYIKKYGQDVPK
jgi:ABC-type nitrate/sulfonate/bicarbonate transport system substrate-binding protein